MGGSRWARNQCPSIITTSTNEAIGRFSIASRPSDEIPWRSAAHQPTRVAQSRTAPVVLLLFSVHRSVEWAASARRPTPPTSACSARAGCAKLLEYNPAPTDADMEIHSTAPFEFLRGTRD